MEVENQSKKAHTAKSYPYFSIEWTTPFSSTNRHEKVVLDVEIHSLNIVKYTSSRNVG